MALIIQAGAGALFCLRKALYCRHQVFQILIVQADLLVTSALGQGDWRAFGGAQAEYRKLTTQLTGVHAQGIKLRAFGATGDQQYATVRRRQVSNHLCCQLQSGVHILAIFGHYAGVEGVEQVVQGVHIAAQRGDWVRCAGVGNQGQLAVRAHLHQIAYLQPGSLEAVGLQVSG